MVATEKFMMVDRLRILVESRIHGDMYVRFGGEFRKTCHRNMIRRQVLIPRYFQNVRSYKDSEAKLQSIVLGGTAQLKSQKAFELCTAFASDGAEILNLN